MSADEVTVPALALELLRGTAEAASYTAQQLAEAYQRELATAQATLAAIRGEVQRLLDGPYMPSATALLSVLYPPNVVVSKYREVGES